MPMPLGTHRRAHNGLRQVCLGKGSHPVTAARHRAFIRVCTIPKRSSAYWTGRGVLACLAAAALDMRQAAGNPRGSAWGWRWKSDPFPPPRPHMGVGTSLKFSQLFLGGVL